MPLTLLRSCAAALLLAAPLCASETVTREQALDAVRVFDANALGNLTGTATPQQASDAVAKASNTLLRFALDSDDVVVDLGMDSVPWCDVKRGIADMTHSGERGLLLAAYLSGSVKSQLQSGRRDPNPYAGWTAMLRVYRAMKVREDVAVPEAEVLLAKQRDGTLEAFAAEALNRSKDKLSRAYGPGAQSTPQTAVTSVP